MSGIKGLFGPKAKAKKKEKTSPKPLLRRTGRRGVGVKYKDLSASSLSPIDRQIKKFEECHGFKVGTDFTKEEFINFSGQHKDAGIEKFGSLFAEHLRLKFSTSPFVMKQIQAFEEKHDFKCGEHFTAQEFLSFSGKHKDLGIEAFRTLFAEHLKAKSSKS